MKYSKELVEILCKHLKQGSSIKSACAAVGIHRSLFYKWKESKLDFLDTVTRAMAVPDRKVENALYRTARGFRYTETEYKAIPNKDHTKVELIPSKKIRKMVLPSVVAQKFILINRNPEEWNDKQETELSGEIKVKLERTITDERPQE